MLFCGSVGPCEIFELVMPLVVLRTCRSHHCVRDRPASFLIRDRATELGRADGRNPPRPLQQIRLAPPVPPRGPELVLDERLHIVLDHEPTGTAAGT